MEGLHSELAGLGVDHLARTLTDNGTECKGRPPHPFEALCARLGTEHCHTKVRHAWTNGKAERFVQTVKDLLEELLRCKSCRIIAELQADLDEKIAWYNTCRPHQGLNNHGRPPVQVIREFLRAKAEIGAAERTPEQTGGEAAAETGTPRHPDQRRIGRARWQGSTSKSANFPSQVFSGRVAHADHSRASREPPS